MIFSHGADHVLLAGFQMVMPEAVCSTHTTVYSSRLFKPTRTTSPSGEKQAIRISRRDV